MNSITCSSPIKPILVAATSPFLNKRRVGIEATLYCNARLSSLFGIRNNNLNVDYKAVMTKTNKSWTLNKILYHMEIEKKNERR